MHRKGSKWIGVFCLLCLVGWAGSAWAVYIDDERTLEFVGKAQTRTSIRLQHSEGFTHPHDIAAGNVVQWRNLAVFEINHDLMNLTHDLDILYPLKALDISAKYHIVGRFMYEAIYDVGPQAFQDVRTNDKENIDNFKQQYDLWEFYFDLSRGPLFLRLGKQNLAWGETDTFRLLDAINPLDNTFGGPFEDLDDRRIPLWMLRGSYNLGGIGPISSAMIEAFWVPGNLDVSVAPYAPCGHGLRGSDRGYGHEEVPGKARQEDVQQSVGRPPDGRSGEQPQLECRPLQDLSGHAHGPVGGRAGNTSRDGDELFVSGTDLGGCADHGRLLQLL